MPELYNKPNTLNDLLRAAHPYGGTDVVHVQSPSGGEGRVEDSIEQQLKMLRLVYTEPTARVLANLAADIEKDGLVTLAASIDKSALEFVRSTKGLLKVADTPPGVPDPGKSMLGPGNTPSEVAAQSNRPLTDEEKVQLVLRKGLSVGARALKNLNLMYQILAKDPEVEPDVKQDVAEELAELQKDINQIFANAKAGKYSDAEDVSEALLDTSSSLRGFSNELKSTKLPGTGAMKDGIFHIIPFSEEKNVKTFEEIADRQFKGIERDLNALVSSSSFITANNVDTALNIFREIDDPGSNLDRPPSPKPKAAPQVKPGETKPNPGELEQGVSKEVSPDGKVERTMPGGNEQEAEKTPAKTVRPEQNTDKAGKGVDKDLPEVFEITSPVTKQKVRVDLHNLYNHGVSSPARYIQELRALDIIPKEMTDKEFVESSADNQVVFAIADKMEELGYNTNQVAGFRRLFMGFSDKVESAMKNKKSVFDYAMDNAPQLAEKMMSNPKAQEVFRDTMYRYRYSDSQGWMDEELLRDFSPSKARHVHSILEEIAKRYPAGEKMLADPTRAEDSKKESPAEQAQGTSTEEGKKKPSNEFLKKNIRDIASALINPGTPAGSKQMVIDKGFAQAQQAGWPGTKEEYIKSVNQVASHYQKQQLAQNAKTQLPAEIQKAVQEAAHSKDHNAVRTQKFRELVSKYRGVYDAQTIGKMMQDAWANELKKYEVAPGVQQLPSTTPGSGVVQKQKQPMNQTPRGRQGLSAQPSRGMYE